MARCGLPRNVDAAGSNQTSRGTAGGGGGPSSCSSTARSTICTASAAVACGASVYPAALRLTPVLQPWRSCLTCPACRHGPGTCVKWDASREAEGSDLRQFDWVVFGLADRPEFDLRHLRCPFLSADSNSTGEAACIGAETAGGECGAPQVLQVDAVVVTDRELMYNLDTAALVSILGMPWARGLHRLSFDRAVVVAWILEPPVIASAVYEHVDAKPDRFDLVFSHNEEFLAALPGDRGRYVPLATCLIPPHQRGDSLRACL